MTSNEGRILNRSEWVEKYILSALRLPGVSPPDEVLLRAAWKTLEEGRVPERIGETILPREVRTRLNTLLGACHRVKQEGRVTKGAMLRGKRKKRKRPKGGGRSAPAVQGLRRLRELLSGIIPWKRKDPTATIITCALEGKSVYSLWQDKKEERPLREQPYTCNKTTMRALKGLTEEDLEKLREEIKRTPEHCLSKLPHKERRRIKKLLRKKGVLALDFKEQPYHGKKLSDEKLLHPVEKGNRRGTVAMVLSRCDRGIRLPKHVHYIPAETPKAELLPRIRGELREARLLLADSGLYNHRVVERLAGWETPFLTPANRGSLTIPLAAVAALVPPGNTLTLPHDFGGTPIHPHFRVRGPKRGRGGKHEISVFASSEENPSDVREYGLRWGVENQNRDFQKFLVPTSSTSATVRLFFLTLALHLYALWAVQSLLALIRRCRENNKHLTFWEGQPIRPLKKSLLSSLAEDTRRPARNGLPSPKGLPGDRFAKFFGVLWGVCLLFLGFLGVGCSFALPPGVFSPFRGFREAFSQLGRGLPLLLVFSPCFPSLGGRLGGFFGGGEDCA